MKSGSESTVCRTALGALRDNLVPGMILQGVMVCILIAYYFHDGTRAFFGWMATLKEESGFLYAFAGTAIASAVLPAILKLSLEGQWNMTLRHIGRFFFSFVVWGLLGVIIDIFYRLQCVIFGSSTEIGTMIKKTLFDGFVFCPFVAVPMIVIAFAWLDNNYSFNSFRGPNAFRILARRIFVVLVADWIVWLPLVFIIYSLPPGIQIPFYIIAQCFWVLVFTRLVESAEKTGNQCSYSQPVAPSGEQILTP